MFAAPDRHFPFGLVQLSDPAQGAQADPARELGFFL